MATHVTKDPFPGVTSDDLLIKVALHDPEREHSSEIMIEGFGPETIIGVVKDLVRTGHHHGSKVERIVIDFPPNYTD